MKTLIALLLGGVIAIGCWVDRKTNDFACTSDAQCAGFSNPTRTCDEDLGYCVPGDNPAACPDFCNGGCDMAAKTCTANCANAPACDDLLVCPEGWTCTFNCGTAGCDAIRCENRTNCTINCNGSGACGTLDCSFDDGRCNVTCMGANACDLVDCNNANCQVTCNGANACSNVDCDTACRCEVGCATANSCDNIDCLDLDCDGPDNSCVSSQAGCPSSCP